MGLQLSQEWGQVREVTGGVALGWEGSQPAAWELEEVLLPHFSVEGNESS